VITTLHRDPLVFVYPPDHKLPAKRRISLAQVAHKPFVDLPPEWTVRQLVDRAFGDAGLARTIAIEVNDITTCLELVQHGVGVTILPQSAGARGFPLAFRPLARRLTWEFVIARRADGPGNPAARELLRRLPGFASGTDLT
jgi:DNA-binding transcriptional LysR family regulator